MLHDSALEVLVIDGSAGSGDYPPLPADDRLHVTPVDRVTSALGVLGTSRFDAIVIDVYPSDVSALDAVSELHAASPDVPIVVWASMAGEDIALRAVHEGAHDYLLAGSADADAVVHAVRTAAERSSSDHARRFLAKHDHLTGLITGVIFRDRLLTALARATRRHSPMAVAVVDVDGFAALNRTLGREVGDAMLRAVADRLVSRVREVDSVARLGGDEFTIVLEDVGSRAAALKVVRRLLDGLGRPMNLLGRRASPSASAGVALWPDHADTVDGLLSAAVGALDRAREMGGGHAALAPGRRSARRLVEA